MIDRLAQVEARFYEVEAALSDPTVAADPKRMAGLSKEYKELGKIHAAKKRYDTTLEALANAKEILAEETDDDFIALAKEEIADLEPKMGAIEQELKQLLIPKEPEDSMNVLLEIRAGTGGDEAALFVGDLFRMYERYCENRGWKLTVTDFNEGTSGGYKEILATVEGEDAYGTLKYESGVHRVQRVPATETQGRVHTSAASVVAMPEPEEFEFEIAEKDVRIDKFCASGNGGQSVNTTYSAVRLTHEPTGIVVSMQNERSQLKNLDLAWKVLKTRIYEQEMQKRKAKEADARKSLVSGGDRSAKIRTYNYPQSRVTDHRIGKSVHNLPAVLAGQLDEFLEALRIADNAERLAAGEAVV